MNEEQREQLRKADLEFLTARPEFRRFLFRVIQSAGIFSSTTDGADGRNLEREGRRNLGLEILDWADAVQPVSGHEGIPVLTVIQAFREESQATTQEKPNARPRYDRHADIDPDRD